MISRVDAPNWHCTIRSAARKPAPCKRAHTRTPLVGYDVFTQPRPGTVTGTRCKNRQRSDDGASIGTGQTQNGIRNSAMTNVFVDTTKITDWPSFHRVFSQIFGFPAFYGNNMDALIDCLSYLDDPEAAMTSLHVRPGETLAIQLGAVISFRRRCPDLFESLQDACAFVNWRRTREHGAALVALSYYD